MGRHTRQIVLISLCFLSLGTGPTRIAASTVYVSVNSTNPIPPYVDWSTSATNIQDAIDAASTGDHVLVSDGTYIYGGRPANGSLSNRVVLDKPLVVKSLNGPAVTVIRGFSGTSFTSVRCAYVTNGATLSGFTLTNGFARSGGSITNDGNGGGAWCEPSGVITNCYVVHNNSRFASGAGVFGGIVWDSLFEYNTNASYGLAMAAAKAFNCIVRSNYSISGGSAADSCVLSNCILLGNSASSGGAAANSTLLNCQVLSNTASGSGGGLYICKATNSVIVGNKADSSGAGAFSTLVNCLVAWNSARFGGVGDAPFKFINCTIVQNTAAINVGGINGGNVLNSIVDGNTSPADANYASSTIMSNCCTFPLPTNGESNFTNGPAFLTTTDFHLQPTSPCINSGRNPFSSTVTDLDGNPRIVAGTIDIGAYEYQPLGSILSYAWLQQFGLPTDGSADFADTDADGANNWQEWIAGTVPTNSASVLTMLSPAISTNSVLVKWHGVSGKSYIVERSTTLSTFTALSGTVPGQNGINTFTDTNSPGTSPAAYRVRVQ